MNIGTYQCEHCGSKIDYDKPYGTEWPENFYCNYCEEKSMKKLLSNLGGISVPEGRVGNGAKGWK